MSTMLDNYNAIISDLAERASDYFKDGEEDETEAINQAIDDGLIYYEDQAIILGGYICTYCPKWGDSIDWEEVYTMLYDDISEELQNIKEREA